jgi:putative heme iron utilization protein
MNEDHSDALELYATKLLDLSPGPWSMTGIDSEGLDLRLGGRVARLRFDNPLRSAAEVRKVLVDLASRARAA